MSDRNRRLLLGGFSIGLLGLAGVRGDWFQGLLPAPDFAFEPMERPAGYRMLKAGAISFGGGVPVFGLDQGEPAGLTQAKQSVEDDLPGALFGETEAGKIPVAYFFDYQCPICRRLSPALLAQANISISWHDLAGLGPASETAARAAIAARAQGAYAQFHERLMRARFQATDAYVSTLAESAGIDAPQLLADMVSDETQQRLWQSRALAILFGMAGTPGLVIGKSVVIGDIGKRDLERIIQLERV